MHFKEPEYTLTMVIIPAAIIAIFLGVWFVQRERTIGAVAIIVSFSASNMVPSSYSIAF